MRTLTRCAAVFACAWALAGAARADERRDLAAYRASEQQFHAALAAERRGLADDARAGYERALALDPAFAEAAVNLARLALAASDFDGAERWLARAEAGRPDYPRIAATRGLLALARGETVRALELLTAAQRALPEDTEIAVNLGAALIRRERFADARALLGAVLRAQPDASDAHYNLALAADAAGDRDAARFAYQRFLALSSFADPAREGVAQRLAELAASDARAVRMRETGLNSEARANPSLGRNEP
ncbi:MAG TPA: tetratricopeptide repeat protein [Myxococcota bacterium]|nr:tetratricopeptide repeat protein [Myxococcota bacterium]